MMNPRIMSAAELARYTGKAYSEAVADAWILAGQQVIENYINRALCYGQYTERTATNGKGLVLLRAYPVDMTKPFTVTVDGRETDKWTLYGHGMLAIYDHRTAGMLNITYTGGYTELTMPEPIKIACALIVNAIESAQVYNGQQIVSERLDGYSVTYAQQAASMGMERLAPAAAALLRPYTSKAW